MKKKSDNDKVEKRRCKECGNHVNYYVAGDFPAADKDVAAVQAMQPVERNQEIAKRMLVLVKPKRGSKLPDYRMHPAKTFVWFMPANASTKWTNALVLRIAKMLAPFAKVTRAEMRVGPEFVSHFHE